MIGLLNFTHLGKNSFDFEPLLMFIDGRCGHCKQLAPIYEKVAEELKEAQINVGSVDVPANREIGTRFEIKGFPTIKLIKNGKVYTFKGRRTVSDIVEFAKSSFQIQEPEEVPPQTGFFGEITYVFRQAYKKARSDVTGGHFFTADVVLVSLPVIFIALVLLFVFIPIPTPVAPPVEREKVEKTE